MHNDLFSKLVPVTMVVSDEKLQKTSLPTNQFSDEVFFNNATLVTYKLKAPLPKVDKVLAFPFDRNFEPITGYSMNYNSNTGVLVVEFNEPQSGSLSIRVCGC